MSTSITLWNKLASSKEYREEFVSSQVKQGIPFQIYAMRRDMDISQKELAERSDLTQGVVSRAEDPDYGNLTLNTIIRIAAGFDVAFIGNFVPFSELVEWYENLSEDSVKVEAFEKEYRRLCVTEPHRRRKIRKVRIRSSTEGSLPYRSAKQTNGGSADLRAAQYNLFESQTSSGKGIIIEIPKQSSITAKLFTEEIGQSAEIDPRLLAIAGNNTKGAAAGRSAYGI